MRGENPEAKWISNHHNSCRRELVSVMRSSSQLLFVFSRLNIKPNCIYKAIFSGGVSSKQAEVSKHI